MIKEKKKSHWSELAGFFLLASFHLKENSKNSEFKKSDS
jgi:hypothetical protein